MRWEYCSTSRPKQGESVSGDAASVFDDETKLLCVVADGLGHGPEAARASEAFVDYVSRARHLSLDEMMLAGSAHIASTRGAAVSLMRIDLDRMVMEYCGVGNCHLHVYGSTTFHPVSMPGIVGHRIRKVLTLEEPVTEAEGLFLLCSDGISSSLHAELFSQLDAEGAVAAVLDSLGKDYDDATVLAVRLFGE